MQIYNSPISSIPSSSPICRLRTFAPLQSFAEEAGPSDAVQLTGAPAASTRSAPAAPASAPAAPAPAAAPPTVSRPVAQMEGWNIAGVSPARQNQQPAKTGFDRSNMDLSVDPNQNFFRYAMGSFLRNHPIPESKSSWGIDAELVQRVQLDLKGILEGAAGSKAAQGSVEQKIGDFYASGMDTATMDAAGLQPVQSFLDRINNISNLSDLQGAVADMHRHGIGAFFEFGSGQDARDATKVIGQAYQGGLSLPDRDYYTDQSPEKQELRAKFTDHVARTFELQGQDPETARKSAETVMRVETALAEASLTNVELRDPAATYHPTEAANLDPMTPNFSWSGYFQAMGHPDIQTVNVATPSFFEKLNGQLADTPLDDLKTYLNWHVLRDTAGVLSEPFRSEDFAWTKVMTGVKAPAERWETVAATTDKYLGDGVGQKYVELRFPPEAKAKAEDMVQDVLAALKERIQNAQWMGDDTRAAALDKLAHMNHKIGYPERWTDYGNLQIDRGPFAGNVLRAREFANQQDWDRIGKPVDHNQWGMTPATVNAYYDPTVNEFVFPAAILQPPYFDMNADDAMNYGTTAATIGHEITHGFDDQGAQYDAQGNLRNWWSEADLANFSQRAKGVEEQFNNFEFEGVKTNGKLVLGESLADLGGLEIAYRAFHRKLDREGVSKDQVGNDGFTPDQRFFLSYAQSWGTNIRPEKAKLQLATDPHPLPEFRVNGPLANIPEFAQAFGLQEGSPMVRPESERNRLWT